MNKKTLLIISAICLLVVLLYDKGIPPEEANIRVACNDDAAGLLIQYIAANKLSNIKAVNMTYQQLQDCCGSRSNVALASSGYDMAVLCPDSAARLIEVGQPYINMGPIVYNANVLVTLADNQNKDNFATIGYMNLRDIQIHMLRQIFGDKPELQPIMPSALPYALEKCAVEAVVLDILSALRMEAIYIPLEYQRPANVLVVHEDFAQTTLFTTFLEAYNEGVTDLEDLDILHNLLKQYYAKENCGHEVKEWQRMKTSYRYIFYQPASTS